ncbi:PREDICTED: uncharacterized protein LOC109471045 isoform X1 [Branchiostoma belcheri]|uniref:Uncharacterized protein LOC109471045 isoform X1 n=2 Tax=Branchiostoma belcheri TaxID=7741 RepID=A0A6P4YVM0_BRABE|nr:PREDICTED: uncharacterized protein LOC109471045 isoform X1 [Branchiostoma belcheri]
MFLLIAPSITITMFHHLASVLSVRAVEPDTPPEEGTDPPEETRPQYRRIPRDPAMLSQYPPTKIPWLSSSPEAMGLGKRGSMQTYLEECQSCRWISGLTFIGAGVYVYMSSRARLRYTRSTGPLFRIFFGLCLGVAGVTILVDPQKKIQDDWLRKYEERQRRLKMRQEQSIAKMEKEEEAALNDANGSVQK